MSARPRQARRKGGSGQARRPAVPLRRRIGARLPSRGRVLALLAMSVLLAGTVVLINGPWLRVERVAHAGERFTDVEQLDEVLAAYRGASLLTVDSHSVARRVMELPAVADARVETDLGGELRVALTEKQPAVVWLTSAVRLVAAGDGTVIGHLSRSGEMPPELASLPLVDDQRRASRWLTVGDRIPTVEMSTGLRLLEVDPDLLGSDASRLVVRIDDEYGFVLVSRDPAWRAALGFYGLDPREPAASADARLQAQVTAIRTLFDTRSEATVTWLDARNPGKVYWAP